jgi:hypothetical protein
MSHVPPHQPGGVIQAPAPPNMVHPGQNIIQAPQMAPGQHPGGYMPHIGASLQQPGMYGQPPGPYMPHTGNPYLWRIICPCLFQVFERMF